MKTIKITVSLSAILRIVLFIFTSISTVLYSQTKMPSFFSDNMVFQRNERVAIWGQDDPNVQIKVTGSWGKEAYVKSDKNGYWKLELQTPDAGGPYNVVVNGTDTVILSNVLIGEVWLCSGQSNMWMPLKGYDDNSGINGSIEAILNSNNNQIRFFSAERTASLKPLTDSKGEWKISKPSTVANFSALAYFFGAKLQDVLNVPIGLIHTSWGGSKVEAWMDKETLSKFENVKIPDKIPENGKNQAPSLLYNGMLKPFIPFTIKGFIWYQGESNVYEVDAYKKLFPAMIRSWRKKWKQINMPFYFVQIAPYGYGKHGEINSAYLREAQLQTMQTVDNTGMAVTLDIGNCENIHPAEKKLIGNRLAYLALANNYDIKEVSYNGPIYKSMEKTTDSKIKISFGECPNGLSIVGKKWNGFRIAGEDKIFYNAKAKINKDRTLSVWSEQVKKPIAVRYAFDNCTKGTLYSADGLPASSFRTDDWKEK